MPDVNKKDPWVMKADEKTIEPEGRDAPCIKRDDVIMFIVGTVFIILLVAAMFGLGMY